MILRYLHIGLVNLLHCWHFPRPSHLLRVSLSTHIRLNAVEIIAGKKFSTRRNVEINLREKARLIIGDQVFINSGSIIAYRNHIQIGDNTILGTKVMIFNHDHAIFNGKPANHRFESDAIHIGKDVRFDTCSIMLKGSKIQDESIVAAGFVINKEIPEGNIFEQRRKSELMPIHHYGNKN